MQCQAETEQDHSGKAREQAEAWEEAAAEAEWAEIVRERDPAVPAFVHSAERKRFIRQVFPVIL